MWAVPARLPHLSMCSVFKTYMIHALIPWQHSLVHIANGDYNQAMGEGPIDVSANLSISSLVHVFLNELII